MSKKPRITIHNHFGTRDDAESNPWLRTPSEAEVKKIVEEYKAGKIGRAIAYQRLGTRAGHVKLIDPE